MKGYSAFLYKKQLLDQELLISIKLISARDFRSQIVCFCVQELSQLAVFNVCGSFWWLFFVNVVKGNSAKMAVLMATNFDAKMR
jgi:hypothetical protein